jgi:hypothetical protein
VTIGGDRYIDGVYLTDANLMEAIAAAPTSLDHLDRQPQGA